MLVTQAKYVAPDISGVSKSRVKKARKILLSKATYAQYYTEFMMGITKIVRKLMYKAHLRIVMFRYYIIHCIE